MSVDTERFSTVPLFEGLKPMEIMGILKITEDVIANPGEVVVKEGDPGDGFFVIGKGSFDVVKGKSEPLAKLGELSFFGEMSLVLNEPRTASVICVEEGRLKKFPVAKFEELFEAGDAVAGKVMRNIARMLAERLRRLDERFVSEVWKTG